LGVIDLILLFFAEFFRGVFLNLQSDKDNFANSFDKGKKTFLISDKFIFILSDVKKTRKKERKISLALYY
jgi:hypothetical protein